MPLVNELSPMPTKKARKEDEEIFDQCKAFQEEQIKKVGTHQYDKQQQEVLLQMLQGMMKQAEARGDLMRLKSNLGYVFVEFEILSNHCFVQMGRHL